MTVMTLLFLAFAIASSIVAHEYGHALVARVFGWELRGWMFTWYGVVYKLVAPERATIAQARAIAAGGLVATAGMALTGALIGELLGILICTFNIIIFITNVIPFPGSDGWVILTGRMMLAKTKDK